MSLNDFEFEGPVVEWRGPAPLYFLRLPEEESTDIKLAAKGIECWGQVPVVVRIRDTEFTTALFPKDGHYPIPLKVAVRKSAGIDVDNVVAVQGQPRGGVTEHRTRGHRCRGGVPSPHPNTTRSSRAPEPATDGGRTR